MVECKVPFYILRGGVQVVLVLGSLYTVWCTSYKSKSFKKVTIFFPSLHKTVISVVENENPTLFFHCGHVNFCSANVKVPLYIHISRKQFTRLKNHE